MYLSGELVSVYDHYPEFGEDEERLRERRSASEW